MMVCVLFLRNRIKKIPFRHYDYCNELNIYDGVEIFTYTVRARRYTPCHLVVVAFNRTKYSETLNATF